MPSPPAASLPVPPSPVPLLVAGAPVVGVQVPICSTDRPTKPSGGWGTGKDALGLSVMFKGPESGGSKLEWVQTPLEEESGTFWSLGDRQHFHVEEQ